MRLLKTRGSLPRGSVDDVVGVIRCNPRRNRTQPRTPAHPISDRMIRARTVSRDAQTTDNLAVAVKRYAAAERNDSTDNKSFPCFQVVCRRVEQGIERIRIVQAI